MNEQVKQSKTSNVEDTPSPERTALVSEHELSEGDRTRVEQLRKQIKEYYDDIPFALRGSPKAQKKCLNHLFEAESNLARSPLSRGDIIDSKVELTKVEIELVRAKGRRRSPMVVGLLFYAVVGVAYVAFQYGPLRGGSAPADLNKQLLAGVPLPVWIWATVGSLTAMLLRAGQFPFVDLVEAGRWLLFRPIVGIVMGVLTYLLVVAGLIVFAGSTEAQAPELIWVIAFIGGFSDNLSVDLLQRILGQFRAAEVPANSEGQE